MVMMRLVTDRDSCGSVQGWSIVWGWNVFGCSWKGASGSASCKSDLVGVHHGSPISWELGCMGTASVVAMVSGELSSRQGHICRGSASLPFLFV